MKGSDAVLSSAPPRQSSNDVRMANVVMLLAAFIWLGFVHASAVADVWDETDILIALQAPPFGSLTLAEGIGYLWTNFVSLYRPLAASMLFLLARLGLDFSSLRFVNAALLLGSAWILARLLMARYAAPGWAAALFFALVLGSSGALITAGWFANVFDASSLFLIAAAIHSVVMGRPVTGGVLAGLAFFCKETAILAVPFMFVALLAPDVRARSVLKALAATMLLAAVYALLRQRVVALGSPHDFHTFAAGAFWPSLVVFAQGFWWGHTKFPPAGVQAVLGAGLFVLSLAAVRGLLGKGIALTVLALSSVVYWGMFAYQDQVMLSQNFIGRLYLIPTVLMLFLLVATGGHRLLFVLSVPLLGGAMATYSDHVRFQQVYLQIYERAANSSGTTVVHYPYRALNDPVRRVRIGHFPDAPLVIDPVRPALVDRR